MSLDDGSPCSHLTIHGHPVARSVCLVCGWITIAVVFSSEQRSGRVRGWLAGCLLNLTLHLHPSSCGSCIGQGHGRLSILNGAAHRRACSSFRMLRHVQRFRGFSRSCRCSRDALCVANEPGLGSALKTECSMWWPIADGKQWRWRESSMFNKSA